MMDNASEKRFRLYWLFACLGVLLLSAYPLMMGVRVIGDMLCEGTVMKEAYPKYIIPYTPISAAVLAGALSMPLWIRRTPRLALLWGSLSSVTVFFVAELLFERKVVVTSAEATATLEDWQMYMCFAFPPEGWGETAIRYRTQTPVEILMGEYSPAFKLHFYLISLVLILSVLGVLYGFARMILSGDKSKRRVLTLQASFTGVFLGLCILACFTAFWRDGSLEISPLSASLMAAFFILLGLVGGLGVGLLCPATRPRISRTVAAAVASGLTALMYIGEMILLGGHLYRFGEGVFFDGLPLMVLAPVDIAVILLPGVLCALLLPGRKGKILP